MHIEEVKSGVYGFEPTAESALKSLVYNLAHLVVTVSLGLIELRLFQ